MAVEKLVLRYIVDHRRHSRTVELQDESGDNTYETVTLRMFQSLPKEMIYQKFAIGSMELEVYEYRATPMCSTMLSR